MELNHSRKWIDTMMVAPVGPIHVNLILIDAGYLDENRRTGNIFRPNLMIG